MLLSKISFSSFLAYCPREKEGANNEEIRKSKTLTYKLKFERSVGTPPMFMSQLVSKKIKENLQDLPFKDFFGEGVWLVPVPKSSLMKADTLWVPDRICRELANLRLGIYHPCLERFKPVNVAHSNSSKRLAIEHFKSIKFESSVHRPKEILLIDDIITSGSTLLGCASILKEHFPDVLIRGFSVIRTISKPEKFEKINDSCIGEITLNCTNGMSLRTP